MDKKDFLLPGIVLGLVIITGLGVLLTHQDTPRLLPLTPTATSTMPSTASSTAPSTAATALKGHAVPAAHYTPSAYYPYGTVVLALNQAAIFKDGVSIRPIEPLSDSRCPTDVYCIQAGTVSISLKVNVNGESSVKTMQLGRSISVGPDTITLDAVSPERTSTGKYAPSAYRLTFTVKHGASDPSLGPCYVGGCSAQLCTDAPGAISTCLYTASFGCYRTATCERQADGACGWTQTESLKACLANPPQE